MQRESRIAYARTGGGRVALATGFVSAILASTCCLGPLVLIKNALSKVQGVAITDVNFEKREATVTFDDSLTGIEALMRATRDAGYPSTLAGGAK
jgi:periplasmic mercuric ion binding protein